MKNAVFVLLLAGAAVNGQDTTYQPGITYQSSNPNYPVANPFYFEGRVDWDLLHVDQPSNAWEFAQRGIHKQDDLEDFEGAADDYRTAISMNNLENGTCQIVTSAPPGFGRTLSPPPCMFTVRLRLGNLLKESDPTEAIALFRQVLEIDPLRLGVNALIGQTYALMADKETDLGRQTGLRSLAVAAYKGELALSPVNEFSKKLTGDEANNAHVHWALAGLYEKMNQMNAEIEELDLYLKATKWHSDTYPWRIALARNRMNRLEHMTNSGSVNIHR